MSCCAVATFLLPIFAQQTQLSAFTALRDPTHCGSHQVLQAGIKARLNGHSCALLQQVQQCSMHVPAKGGLRTDKVMGEQHLQVRHLGLELVSGGVPAAGVVVGAALHRADLVEGGGLVQRWRDGPVGVLRHLGRVEQPGRQALLPRALCSVTVMSSSLQLERGRGCLCSWDLVKVQPLHSLGLVSTTCAAAIGPGCSAAPCC